MLHVEWMGQNKTAQILLAALMEFGPEGLAKRLDRVNATRIGRFAKMLQLTDQWAAAGRNVVELSPRIQETFAMLDLGSIKAGELFLPHAGVYFDFPDCAQSLWTLRDEKQMQLRVRGCYVVRVQTATEPPRIIMGGQVIGGECWSFYLWASDGHPTDDAFYLFTVPLDQSPESNLEEKLVSSFANLNRDTPESLRTGAQDSADLDVVAWALRVITNAILYWTSPKAELLVDATSTRRHQELAAKLNRAKGGKKKDLERALTRVVPHRRTKFLCEPAAEPHDGVRRHKVPAHWSHYWVGPNHPHYDTSVIEQDGKHRVRLLVQEHWRGEDAVGRVLSRVYKVGAA